MFTLGDSEPVIQRWMEGRERAGLKSNQTHCVGCFYGKGGALFVSLRRLSGLETGKISLSRTLFQNNSALIGGNLYPRFLVEMDLVFCVGAGYFDTPQSDSSRQWCTPKEHKAQVCSFVQYTQLQLENNEAALAGGGIFMSGSKDPYSFCERPHAETFNSESFPGGSCFKTNGNSVGVRIPCSVLA